MTKRLAASETTKGKERAMAHTWKDERPHGITKNGRGRSAKRNRWQETSTGDSPVVIKPPKYNRTAEKRRHFGLEDTED